jgi:hypothetical protein
VCQFKDTGDAIVPGQQSISVFLRSVYFVGYLDRSRHLSKGYAFYNGCPSFSCTFISNTVTLHVYTFLPGTPHLMIIFHMIKMWFLFAYSKKGYFQLFQSAFLFMNLVFSHGGLACHLSKVLLSFIHRNDSITFVINVLKVFLFLIMCCLML